MGYTLWTVVRYVVMDCCVIFAVARYELLCTMGCCMLWTVVQYWLVYAMG